ncbi:hypothetical protein [Peribacillus loiseleuriae]
MLNFLFDTFHDIGKDVIVVLVSGDIVAIIKKKKKRSRGMGGTDLGFAIV